MIKKVKSTVPFTYVTNELNGEEIIGTFYEIELQKNNQQELRIEKVTKRKGDKLYVKWKGLIVPVLVDLSKLSDVVKNDVVKKTVYDKLAAKVNSIDTSAFVLKTKYDTDKLELENKVPNTSDLVKKADYNTKITEIEGKIPDVSSLATKSSLTAVENKILNVSNLVKKNIWY